MFRVHSSTPLASILGKTNQIHTLIPFIVRNNLIRIITPYFPGSPKRSYSLHLYRPTLKGTFLSPYAFYIYCRTHTPFFFWPGAHILQSFSLRNLFCFPFILCALCIYVFSTLVSDTINWLIVVVLLLTETSYEFWIWISVHITPKAL
jgi:hypothetical protein